MLKRVDIVGNPNIGVFILATDDVAIVPFNLLDEKVEEDNGYVTLVNAKEVDGKLVPCEERTGPLRRAGADRPRQP